MPFLLVGSIKEPEVELDRTRHNFGPLLLGQRARETLYLVNKEHIPFAFAFEKTSLGAGFGDGPATLDVAPLSGVVGPGAELPIELSFGPSIEKLFNFNVELRVKNKPTPLALNVKGEGYSIHDTLLLEDAAGRPVEISAHAPTRLDFGEVHIHDKVVRTLTVVNSGRFNFDVALLLRSPDRAAGGRAPPVTVPPGLPTITNPSPSRSRSRSRSRSPSPSPNQVTPELLTVKKNERAEVQIVYQPMSDAPLPANLELRAKITNGRTYHLPLLGRGKRPRLSFSFASHDFGPCFVVTPKNGMAPVSVDLRLANEDEHEIYFDMPFVATPFLSATASKSVLAPGETSEVLTL